MAEDFTEAPEFSDEELRVALRQVGRDARRTAFAAGRPVFIVKDALLVALHPDGREEVIRSLRPAPEAGRSTE